MLWRRFIFALAIAAAAGGAAAPAGGLPLRGEIRGGLKIDALADLGLTWDVQATAEGVVLRAVRPGVELEVAAQPREGSVWAWKIVRGSVDLAELWPLLRGLVGAAAQGWSASGKIGLSGEGSVSPEAGPAGEVRVTLREGWARSDALELEAGGIELDAVTHDLSAWTLATEQSLRVARVSKAGAEVRDIRLTFGLGAGRVLEVAAGEAFFLGGRIRLRPFRLPLAEPAVNAAADVEALQLGEVARLIPWLLEGAQGRLRGRVELAWDADKGLRVRDGGLDIVKSDDAAFRLAPSPGLLTGSMPPRFALLPWGWARWVTMNNPAYAPLKDIELGREGLQIETFGVTFWPDGPGGDRTATIHIVGRPTSHDLVKAVSMDLNFHGPWSEFLAFGLNNKLGDMKLRFE